MEMNRIIVTREYHDLCHMQVCAVNDATDDEILKVSRSENPCGTELGWCEVVRDTDTKMGPVPCDDDPARTHFLVRC